MGGIKLSDMGQDESDEHGSEDGQPGIMHILDNFVGRVERSAPHLVPFEEIPVMIGSYKGDTPRRIYKRLGWGRMYANTKGPDPYPGEPWGFDNGAWTAFAKEFDYKEAGSRGPEGFAALARETFPVDRFKVRLENALEIADEREAPPKVAVVPDLVRSGRYSLDFSLEWVDELQDQAPEFPWFLAIQNNFTRDMLEDIIEEFDGIFLGGGDTNKFAARKWAQFAHDHGIAFHYARCGTLAKLQHAFQMEAESLDSAFPLFSRVRFSRFLQQYLDCYASKFGTN